MSPASLPDVLDQQREEDRRRSVRALLRHPLLTPDGPDQQAFTLARRHAAWLGDWFASQAGWTLYADHALVRLRKVPGELSDASRGAVAKVPFGRRRYVLACLALAALERAEAQVTLGWLVERVVSLAADPALGEAGITFTLDSQEERRDLVAVARLLLDARVLARVAGAEQAFIARSGDALYDVNRRVLASLLVTRRGASTVTEAALAGRMNALVAEPRPETEEARNREIRHRLVRRLLDDPVLYYADLKRRRGPTCPVSVACCCAGWPTAQASSPRSGPRGSPCWIRAARRPTWACPRKAPTAMRLCWWPSISLRQRGSGQAR